MKKRSLSLSKVYTLIEPGPVVLITTAHKGKQNVMPLAWHTMIEFTPPLIGCVLSNKNFSFTALTKTKECVISIPTVELAKQVVGCGGCSGKTVDKFTKFGLTPEKASIVGAPLIGECYANLECRIFDAKLANTYNFFILEVVKAWINPSITDVRTIHHQGKDKFAVDGEIISIPTKVL